MRAFTHLTDDEILVELGDARHHSPVIGELCKRLEAKRASVDHYELDCPVCRATLEASFDLTTEELTLKAMK